MRRVRPVEVRWKFFSLEEVNKKEGEEVDWEHGRAAPVLRMLALVRRKHGEDGVDRVYDALARARFEREQQLNEPSVCEAALDEAGFDRGLHAAALADPSTKDEVAAEHAGIAGNHGGFGVPTIVLDGGDGPGIFGPVINPVPRGEEAGEMWDRFAWLIRQPGFFEVKRSRPPRKAS